MGRQHLGEGNAVLGLVRPLDEERCRMGGGVGAALRELEGDLGRSAGDAGDGAGGDRVLRQRLAMEALRLGRGPGGPAERRQRDERGRARPLRLGGAEETGEEGHGGSARGGVGCVSRGR